MVDLNDNSWINNFNEEDKEIAKRLLDSLQFFNLDHIEKEITKILDFRKLKTNYAMYPIMDIKILKQYNEKYEYLGLLEKRNLLLTSKSGKQNNDADSEFIFMNYIRNICKTNKNLHNMPLRTEYKKNKIREIILLTDITATGQQVEDFLKYFIKDKTIKSYISLNLITKIHVVCHMSTIIAIKRLQGLKVYSKKNVIEIKYARIVRTVENYFTDNIKEQILAICKKYTKNKHPLGYGDVGLLSIYTHKSSNNVPTILNQYKKKWAGIIEDRRPKEEFIKKEINESDYNLIHIFLIIKENNNAIAQRLSRKLGISILHSRNILSNLYEAQYITSKGYMTDKGRQLYKKLSIKDNSLDIKEIDRYVEKVYYPYYKKGRST